MASMRNPIMLASLCLAALSGCASADREGARTLATAGVNATSAISREVNARADRIAGRVATQNFNYAYASMRNCSTITTAGGAEPICDILATAEERRTAEVPVLLTTLSRVVRLRARAIDQLTAAYRALDAEADFDAQGQFETAIAGATESATALGTAVGLGPIPEVVGAVLRIGGGQLAASAQQRRLMAGSARLRAVAEHVRAALAKEQILHQQADQAAGAIEADARRYLAEAGLAQALPPLKEVVAASGFPSPGDSALQSALQRSQRLAAAALVAGLAPRPGNDGEALAASLDVLDALIAEHRDFEAKRGLSLADLTASVARLTEIVNAARADMEDDDAPAEEED